MSENNQPPAWGCTKEEIRSLRRRFVILYVFFLLLNLIVCQGLVVLHNRNNWPLVREDGIRKYIGSWRSHGWPEDAPGFLPWSKVDKAAYFQGPIGITDMVLAYRYGPNQTRHKMEVFRAGAPFPTMEIKVVTVAESGVVTFANPAKGSSAKTRMSLFGALVNPIIYAGILWFMVGCLPLAQRVSVRRRRYRAWEREKMCPVCGYDILDLPVCPECGTPGRGYECEKNQSHSFE